MKPRTKHLILLILSIIAYIISGINPWGYLEWFLLSLPAAVFVFCLAVTYQFYQFSTFAYVIVFIHVLILLWGAHHTYTINPLFEWIEELFGFSRNHYDRLGHFAQGFTPAILIREFLLTKGFMKKGPLFYLVTFAFILAITATYELGEFTLTFILGRNPEYVTAPQGDVWDAQWDMVYALIGAFTALLLFSKYDDEKMTLMRCSKTPHFLLFYTPIPQFVSDYKK